MTILVAIAGLSALIIIHELGHMLTAKAMGVKVTEFGIGFGPAIIKKTPHKTTYSLRIILLGGFVKMAGMSDDEEGPESYNSKAAWRRALIIFAGPFVNLLAAILIFTVLFMGISPPTTEVKSVVSGTMAADVGLQQGDRIVSFNGENVENWNELVDAVSARRPGDEATIVVERDGGQKELSGTLTADEQDPERPIVGVQPEVADRNYGPLEALGLGVERTVEIIGLFGWFIGQLVTGGYQFSEAVSSPIGVVSVSSDVASQGVQSFATLLAFISTQLAVINLFPLLPLDGGHLFFIAAEKVLRRPISPETLAKVTAFGLALVLMLFVFATYADLDKLFTGQPFIPERGP